MPETRLPRSLPPRQPQDGAGDELGFIFDDASRRLLGLYGDNQGPDTLRFEVEVGGDLFGFTLTPGQSRQIRLPARARLREVVRPPVLVDGRLRPERRWIPFTRLISERVYGSPRGNSPTVLSVTSTEFGSASTTHNHSLPATVDANDGLLIVFAGDNSDFAAYNLIAPTDFTEKADYGWDLSGTRWRLGVYIAVADGTEDGGTANVGSQDSVAGAGQVYRIEAGTWGESTDAVEVSAKAQAEDDNNADPPNHTPSGGTLDYLWIPAAVIQETEASGAPANYTNLTTNSGGDAGLSTARRGLEASSENPGTFTSSTEHWLTATISVEPSTGAAAQDLTGSQFTVSPSFGSHTVDAEYDLTGNVFQIAPSFGSHTVATGPATLTGTPFQVSPAFGDHTVTPGAVGVTGTVFTVAPTFGTHEVDAEYDLTGNVFQVSPSFGDHTVEAGAVTLTGSAFQVSPAFGDHTVGIGGLLEGQAFQVAPSFGTHTVTAGSVNVNGGLFQVSPVFGTGVVFEPIVHTPGPGQALVATAGGKAVSPTSTGQADSSFAGKAVTATGAGGATPNPSSGSAPVKEN